MAHWWGPRATNDSIMLKEGTPKSIIIKLLLTKIAQNEKSRVSCGAKAKLITLYLDTLNSHETSSFRSSSCCCAIALPCLVCRLRFVQSSRPPAFFNIVFRFVYFFDIIQFFNSYFLNIFHKHFATTIMVLFASTY